MIENDILYFVLPTYTRNERPLLIMYSNDVQTALHELDMGMTYSFPELLDALDIPVSQTSKYNVIISSTAAEILLGYYDIEKRITRDQMREICETLYDRAMSELSLLQNTPSDKNVSYVLRANFERFFLIYCLIPHKKKICILATIPVKNATYR